MEEAAFIKMFNATASSPPDNPDHETFVPELTPEEDLMFDLEVDDPIPSGHRGGQADDRNIGHLGHLGHPDDLDGLDGLDEGSRGHRDDNVNAVNAADNDDEPDMVINMDMEPVQGCLARRPSGAGSSSRLLPLDEEHDSSFEHGASAANNDHGQARLSALAHAALIELARLRTSGSFSSTAGGMPMPSSIPPVTTFEHVYSIGSPTHVMEAASLASSSSHAATPPGITSPRLSAISSMFALASPHPVRPQRRPALLDSSASGSSLSGSVQPLLSREPPVLSCVLQGNDTIMEIDSPGSSAPALPPQSAARRPTGRRDSFAGPQQRRPSFILNASSEILGLAPVPQSAFSSSSSECSTDTDTGSGINTSPGPIPIPVSTAPPQRPHHVPGQLHPHHPMHSRYYEQLTDEERLYRPALPAAADSAAASAGPSTAVLQPPHPEAPLAPLAGRAASQASWAANMVLSTTVATNIDPSARLSAQKRDSAVSPLSLDAAVPSGAAHLSSKHGSPQAQHCANTSIDTTATSTTATLATATSSTPVSQDAQPAVQMDCAEDSREHGQPNGLQVHGPRKALFLSDLGERERKERERHEQAHFARELVEQQRVMDELELRQNGIVTDNYTGGNASFVGQQVGGAQAHEAEAQVQVAVSFVASFE
ncbi:hypothetical protein SCUCBS95973_004784 [Sporothrix curviconia]|uniref:Uncharacterized protein n=1 Tax=Sporothrix curviconia TaxID=1260050 RepID=A0ABP0BRG7_9PEZI